MIRCFDYHSALHVEGLVDSWLCILGEIDDDSRYPFHTKATFQNISLYFLLLLTPASVG